jgi:hypothetical protein
MNHPPRRRVPGALRTWLAVFVLALALGLGAGCQTGPLVPDETPGQILPLAIAEISPPPDAQDVPTNGALLVAFTTPLDAAAFARVHFAIEGVEAHQSRGRRTAILWPARPLTPRRTYTVTLRVASPDGSDPGLVRQWAVHTGDRAIASPAHEVPVAAGRPLLFRYPYVQSHLSNTVTVVWATSVPGQATLQIRPEGLDAWLTRPGRSESFPAALTGLRASFFQHQTLVDGLDPGAHYRYQLWHDDRMIATGVPLKTLEAPGADAARFVAFGDSGTDGGEPRALRDAILSRTPDGSPRYPHDFVVGLGDLAYYNGTYTDFNNNFFDQLSGKRDRGHGRGSLLASRPFIAALGNHDYGKRATNVPHAFLTSFVNPPAPGAPAVDAGRYYSFESGDAHFVVLDTMKFDHPLIPGLPEMLAWLDRDLAGTSRKWRIAFFHHAIFAHGEHGTHGDLRQNRTMRQRLAPILQRHGVQLVMFGHDHLYERTKRLRVDEVGRIVRDARCAVAESPRGIVYLAVGIGGGELHERQANPDPCGSPGYRRAVRDYGEGYDFVAMRDGEPVIYDGSDRPPRRPAGRHGFVHAVVTSTRLSVTAYNVEGEVLDRFELTE